MSYLVLPVAQFLALGVCVVLAAGMPIPTPCAWACCQASEWMWSPSSHTGSALMPLEWLRALQQQLPLMLWRWCLRCRSVAGGVDGAGLSHEGRCWVDAILSCLCRPLELAAVCLHSQPWQGGGRRLPSTLIYARHRPCGSVKESSPVLSESGVWFGCVDVPGVYVSELVSSCQLTVTVTSKLVGHLPADQ